MENENVFYIIIGTAFVFTLATTAVFSFLTLTILVCNWNVRSQSVSNLLTINSNIAFLFFVLTFSFQMPFIFQKNEYQENNIISLYCRMRGYICLFGSAVKVSSYVTQAFSRYFITVLYQNRKLLSYRTHIIMILVSWIFSLVLSSLLLISPITFQYEIESRFCILTAKVFYTSFTTMIIAFIIPVNIIMILYGLILWHITHTNRTLLNAATIRNNKRNLKVFQNILILLAIVIIGGGPYLCSIIINQITNIPWPLYSISLLCITTSATVESTIIFFTNEDVKKIISMKIFPTTMTTRAVAVTLRETKTRKMTMMPVIT